MTPEQEDALEVAKLAAMVGSQLRAVDQLTTESRSMPANRININDFISKVKGNPNYQNSNYIAPSNLQQKAIDDAMREALMVPEPTRFVPPPSDIAQQLIPVPSAPSIPAPVVDDEVKNLLKGIDKKLGDLLDLVHNALNQDE